MIIDSKSEATSTPIIVSPTPAMGSKCWMTNTGKAKNMNIPGSPLPNASANPTEKLTKLKTTKAQNTATSLGKKVAE
jgi:hypothetical protein